MLYLDSSMVVKCYVREKGSETVLSRLGKKDRVFTSALSYFEVLAALGRKTRDGTLRKADFEKARDRFLAHWKFSLNVVELDARTMAGVEELVVQHPLRGADAVHLSAALWLREMCRLALDFASDDSLLEFGVADRRLARVAHECGLSVFNPEASA